PNHTKYSFRKYINAIGEEIGVLSPEDGFSVRNPVTKEKSIPETEVGEMDNGVASVAAEGNVQTWISKREQRESG
ncbi:hypothetical protein HAX54_002184, partial [Datura stramonium]|nr:hypothetical protein [Datura stramonium]